MTRSDMSLDNRMDTKKSLVGIGMYKMLGLLGKGNFARVQEAMHTVLKTKVAVKIIDVSHGRQDYVVKNLAREAKLLSMLQHPGIIRLYETIQCGSTYYLVMELATGGDLFTHIKDQPSGRLDEATARLYGRQLVAALKHMHSRGIVHRDLKAENIMFHDARKEQIKIVDFGLSNIYTTNNLLKTHCGSPEYAAPELFVIGKKYGPEVDLWSLGVIFYVMTTGQLPFVSPNDDQTSTNERRRKLTAQINRGLTIAQQKYLLRMSNEYRNVVNRLLTPDANKRLTIRELSCHPWITEKLKTLPKILSETNFDDEAHKMIVNEIAEAVHLNPAVVEAEIDKHKYGKIGGMYNIKNESRIISNSLSKASQIADQPRAQQCWVFNRSGTKSLSSDTSCKCNWRWRCSGSGSCLPKEKNLDRPRAAPRVMFGECTRHLQVMQREQHSKDQESWHVKTATTEGTSPNKWITGSCRSGNHNVQTQNQSNARKSIQPRLSSHLPTSRTVSLLHHRPESPKFAETSCCDLIKQRLNDIQKKEWICAQRRSAHLVTESDRNNITKIPICFGSRDWSQSHVIKHTEGTQGQKSYRDAVDRSLLGKGAIMSLKLSAQQSKSNLPNCDTTSTDRYGHCSMSDKILLRPYNEERCLCNKIPKYTNYTGYRNTSTVERSKGTNRKTEALDSSSAQSVSFPECAKSAMTLTVQKTPTLSIMRFRGKRANVSFERGTMKNQ